MKSTVLKASERKNKWLSVDAEGQVLGRLAVQVATFLMGKHRPDYTPNVVTGDFVVVTNCEKIKVTGNKRTDKLYHHHTGWRRGGLKTIAFKDLMVKKPTEALKLAVKRMLPNNKLRAAYLKRLKLYAGAEHNNSAQKPVNYGE